MISHRGVTHVTHILTARSIQKTCFLMNIFFHHRPCSKNMRHQRHIKTDTLAGTRMPATYRAVLSLLCPKPSRVSRSLRPLWLIVCLMPFPCAQFKYASKTLEAFEQASGSRSQTSSTNCATWSASKRHSCFAVSVEPKRYEKRHDHKPDAS